MDVLERFFESALSPSRFGQEGIKAVYSDRTLSPAGEGVRLFVTRCGETYMLKVRYENESVQPVKVDGVCVGRSCNDCLDGQHDDDLDGYEESVTTNDNNLSDKASSNNNNNSLAWSTTERCNGLVALLYAMADRGQLLPTISRWFLVALAKRWQEESSLKTCFREREHVHPFKPHPNSPAPAEADLERLLAIEPADPRFDVARMVLINAVKDIEAQLTVWR